MNNLENDDKACDTLGEIGFCEEPTLKDMIAIECPKTCGLCSYNGPEDCQNTLSPEQCQNLQGLCSATNELGQQIREKCKYTCGECGNNNGNPAVN
uniref:ShKT domain-containing protein n=1 Tax=Syphacia muris TaxID=451379 RepID=A0A0N5AXV9_9BILA